MRTVLSEEAYIEQVSGILPAQGAWSEEAYLAITDHARRLVEYTDGYLEVLPMPSERHQAISKCLLLLLEPFLKPLGGKVYFAPLRLRIRPGKFREPDLLLIKDPNDARRQNRFWLGADMVVEIVSEDDRDRDLVDKKRDYAEGRVSEYWIVDPKEETITVLVLGRKKYRTHGVFRRGQTATSVTLSGFRASVSDILDAD